jgi:AdoMet-dependent heme synthase
MDVIRGYSHGTTLPCDVPKIVHNIKRKNMSCLSHDIVGLGEDIHIIPLNAGFLLYTKSLFLFASDIRYLSYLNGTKTVEELRKIEGMQSYLEQLNYFKLLSFSENKRVIIHDIDPKYKKIYEGEEYGLFSYIPVTVELDITNNCNFQCIHCFKNSICNNTSNSQKSSKWLSSQQIYQIIQECANLGVPELLLMGGEPLIHKDFLNFVKFASDSGIRSIRTSSNGWLITEKIAKELSNYCDAIQISVHGATPETHDSIVGKNGSWEHNKEVIKILKDYNFKVNISFTILKENVHEFKKMPALVKNWGADSIRYISLTNMGRGKCLNGFTNEEINSIGEELKQLDKQYSENIFSILAAGFPALHEKPNDAVFYGCAAARTLLHISCEGKMNVCGSIERDFVGQYPNNTLLDIWHSPHLLKFRKPMECDCNYRYICAGLCLADL